MSSPTIGLKLPTEGGRPDRPAVQSAGEWGIQAEELGYDSIWMSEAWGADALVELGGIATQTETIRLCTAIVNIYSRTPAVLAMAGTTLQRLSDGRAVLGVGPSHSGTIETLHGIGYDRPVRRTHEAIEVIKELTGGGGEVSYHGEIFEIECSAAFDTRVPVYNAALGEANRRATGRVADGWLPYIFPVSALENAFETIAQTARELGRDPAEIEVTPQILASVNDDSEQAEDAIREYAARYIGRLPNYRNALADWYPDEAEAIGNAWRAGGIEEAKNFVTDELVYELGVAGPPESARKQLREILENPIVDCPIVYVPRSVSDRVLNSTIEELSPKRV